MGSLIGQPSLADVLALARKQHGVVSREQLVELGLSRHAIGHRVRTGRLHRIRRGVFALGRPDLGRRGLFMAAVLSCGPGAALSHDSAAELWAIRRRTGRAIEVSVPPKRRKRPRGLTVHQRVLRGRDVTRRHGIPVTTPVRTLIDLATRLTRDEREGAINEADKLDLVDPGGLRNALDEHPGEPGVAVLRKALDRRTFTMTDTELERRFLPIARRAGLPLPQTQPWINGFKVDFYWPELGLVIETDGLRYHRTPAEQSRDRLRDQTHTAAGLTPLRFTRAQVRFEPGHVRSTLSAVARRLQR